jgi:hypothetical protein
MMTLSGQCSCGLVGFSFSRASLLAYQCHCSVCRKATGSAFSTTLIAPESNFIWNRGGEHVSSYFKEGGYKVSFCSNCGSPVPNKFRNFSLYSVPLGSIDGQPDIRVVAKLHLNSRAQWDKDNFEGTRFPEMPMLQEMLELLHVDSQPA